MLDKRMKEQHSSREESNPRPLLRTLVGWRFDQLALEYSNLCKRRLHLLFEQLEPVNSS